MSHLLDYKSMIESLQASRNNLDLIKESIEDVIDICACEDAALANVIRMLESMAEVPA